MNEALIEVDNADCASLAGFKSKSRLCKLGSWWGKKSKTFRISAVVSIIFVVLLIAAFIWVCLTVNKESMKIIDKMNLHADP